jgi:hypothetical protein
LNFLTDLEKARALLKENKFGSFILYNNGTIHTVRGKETVHLLELSQSGLDMKGYSAASSVIGKTAALLLANAGISAVYADVMSEDAAEVFKRFKIRAVHGELTAQIK